jgi:ubiquinone/menaquinone biosynthesis C-methylase UbiE
MRRAGPRGRLKSVDLTAIDYPDDHFELVTSISVIEHIPEVEKAIAEMYRVLKPGGRLLITTDSAEQPVPYHEGVRYFSHEELKTMFSPYPVTSPWREPDYAKENWGYTYAPGVVQCFVEITKPAG